MLKHVQQYGEDHIEEMTELDTILFYILLHTLFVKNNYQVLGCYIIDYFYVPCHGV